MPSVAVSSAKLAKRNRSAAKLMGGDPDMNAIDGWSCSSAGQHAFENIERAIKKGSGEDASIYEDLTYEAYGPHGVAILMELTTDNRNRTAAEIRSLLTKQGGAIATAGSVSHLFHRKGQIIISRDTGGEDKVMEIALEAS
jgi:transcriptional/translational regulatory protein YebC/TACO1